jgi:predicted RNA-binding Zn-ribbon protein involved in translation (DUF1610 family)
MMGMAQDDSETKPLLPCAQCKAEFRLVGIERTEKPHYDLYTFECPKCGDLETRIARLQ